MEKTILGNKFEKVEILVKELNIENTHENYSKKDSVELNSYGNSLFAKFKIENNALTRQVGLYAFFKNDELLYIGRTHASFHERLSTGYGNISPKNCYIGGQSTNCKMNSYINKSMSDGESITYYVYPMVGIESINNLEARMIMELDPPLNGQIPSIKKQSVSTSFRSVKQVDQSVHLPGILSKSGSITSQVVEYIEKKLNESFLSGKTEVTLTAKQIHNELQFSQRYPVVSSAMDKVFKVGDVYNYDPPSGKGARKEIVFYRENH